MSLVQIENLTKIYGHGEAAVTALDHVNLSVSAGEFVAVMGPSGCGKSTLLHLLGGLDRPTEGRVVIDGQSLADLSDEALSVLRRKRIGFIFQFYNLIPVLDAVETPRCRSCWMAPTLSRQGRRPRMAAQSGLGRAPEQSPKPAFGRAAATCGRRARAWWPSRSLSWPTSRRATSTRAPPTRSWRCWARCQRMGASRGDGDARPAYGGLGGSDCFPQGWRDRRRRPARGGQWPQRRVGGRQDAAVDVTRNGAMNQ